MTTSSDPHGTSASHEEPGVPLWCSGCGTNRYLIVETIDWQGADGRPGILDVAYTCAECDCFYAHSATVGQVAAIVNQPSALAGLLQFGEEYVHCGAPMRVVSHQVRTIDSTGPEQSVEGTFEVVLRTRLLRCNCGFQLELPD